MNLRILILPLSQWIVFPLRFVNRMMNLISHPQRLWTGQGRHLTKRWCVRIVAFRAGQASLLPVGGIPVPVGPAVHALLPVAKGRTVAGCTEGGDFSIGYGLAPGQGQQVSIIAVMTIETSIIETVIESNIHMLGQLSGGFRHRCEQLMAFATGQVIPPHHRGGRIGHGDPQGIVSDFPGIDDVHFGRGNVLKVHPEHKPACQDQEYRANQNTNEFISRFIVSHRHSIVFHIRRTDRS